MGISIFGPPFAPRLPSHWEIFGLDGPTNEHTLEAAYRARLDQGWLGDPLTLQTAYDKCRNDIEAVAERIMELRKT